MKISKKALMISAMCSMFFCFAFAGGSGPGLRKNSKNKFVKKKLITATTPSTQNKTNSGSLNTTLVQAYSPLTITKLELVFNPPTLYCCYSGGSASVMVSGGDGSYTYTWKDIEGNSVGGNTDTFIFGCDGAEFISLMITDGQNNSVDTAFSLICDGGPLVPIPCGQLKTYLQGAWGSAPKGKSPGSYLYANFNAAFPDGIAIGCSDNYSITFTTAKQISNYLPAGARPGPLQQKNVLAGQLLAASLNVGFDNYDPDFSKSDAVLGDAYTDVPEFEGLTVKEIIEIANSVIGGCRNDYSYVKLNQVLSTINENYINGTADKGHLFCTGFASRKKGRAISATSTDESASTIVFPNPTKGRTQIKLDSKVAEPVTVSVFSNTGNLLFRKVFNAGKGSNLFDLNLENIPSQTCLVNINSKTKNISRLMVIAH